jgi:hypothetical protein
LLKTECSVFGTANRSFAMPRLKDNQVPAYRLHRSSGQAVITLNGKDHLLGKHGSAASKAEYRRLTAEWIATRGMPPSSVGDVRPPRPGVPLLI